MINAYDTTWYTTDRRKSMGRFIIGGDTNNIGYVVEKIKNPNGLVVFADAFKKLGASDTEEQPRWTFDPAKITDGCVATVHLKETVIACADGSASAASAGKLADYGISRTVDASFETTYTNGKED
jgi:hypothetical protein